MFSFYKEVLFYCQAHPGKMGMYLLIHLSTWFYIAALCIFTMWHVLPTVKEK